MSGLRVAVSRDEGADGPLSAALRQRGLEPVPCPAVATAAAADPRPLAAAAADLGAWSWLVFASARGVEALRRAAGGAPLPREARTAAVGPATAAALAAWGARGTLVPEAGGGAAALVRALAGADRWPGRTVLLPRAAGGGRELAGALRAWGADVHEVEAYRTVPRPAAAIRADWRAAAPHAAVVASPSAAQALLAALGAAALRGVELVAIGSTTAAALARAGLTPRIPARPDFDAAAALFEPVASRPGKENAS